MRQFKWIDWNLQKIGNHGLAAADVEAAFIRVLSLQERRDGSLRCSPHARRPAIWIIWRYDREDDDVPDIFFDDTSDAPIFVITAY